MAMNAVPRMISPRNGVDAVLISAANGNRDGTGTVAIVFTAGAEGSLIEMVKIQAIVTTTVGIVRLFLHDGAAFFLYEEIAVTAITVAAGVLGFEATFIPDKELVLPSGWSLRASTEKAESFHVTAQGGDY